LLLVVVLLRLPVVFTARSEVFMVKAVVAVVVTMLEEAAAAGEKQLC